MTPQTDLLLGAQHEALYGPGTDEEQLDAYVAIRLAAIAEGFCPSCGGRLSPGRTCTSPKFCGASGGGVWWTKDGIAMMFEHPLTSEFDTPNPEALGWPQANSEETQ